MEDINDLVESLDNVTVDLLWNKLFPGRPPGLLELLDAGKENCYGSHIQFGYTEPSSNTEGDTE